MRRNRSAIGTPVVMVLLTGAMGLSMMHFFLLGALGPQVVRTLSLSPTLLGATTTVSCAVAALSSPLSGRMVDRVGPRRSLVVLMATAAAALLLIGVAPGPLVLLASVALGGLAQALANPATNSAIAADAPAEHRALITGVKQSGVQLAALAAGLPLAWLSAAAGWRVVAWVMAAVAAGAALWGALALPVDRIDRTGRPTAPRPPLLPRGTVAWLLVLSVPLGGGIACVNTYITLYATDELGLGDTQAAALVAVVGGAGIVGRMACSRAARSPQRTRELPALLLTGSVVATLLLAFTVQLPLLVWFAAAAIGLCAVSVNAVTMMLVLQDTPPEQAGHDSAMVSAGFFAGFALTPPLFGLLVDSSGRWTTGWLLVAAEFTGAALLATAWRLREAGRARRSRPVPPGATGAPGADRGEDQGRRGE
ncbi:MFS transporter [Streptomyces sp. HNM0645]|uniref:MFS transporter n=1 Tax=Streptomyces sp. HNM0645 TaxID=2782343 RepID=UPI0024B76CE6|nr:MFS transporter [Streptomyces sp. HNM0645]MDI9889486.1 MFS transporter [Streptomyces sp. HNM0645]